MTRMVFPGLERAVTEMTSLAQHGEDVHLDRAQLRRLALHPRYLHHELTLLLTSSTLVGRAVETHIAWTALAAERPEPVEVPTAELLQALNDLLTVMAAPSESPHHRLALAG
jgi:hypothetical protein